MSKFISSFPKDTSGTTAIEYGLIAAFVVMVLVTALGLIGTSLATTFTKVSALFG